MFKLKFASTAEGKRNFEICYQAVILSPRMPEIKEWDDVTCLIGALKRAGIPAKEIIRGQPLYDLRLEGAEINLQRSEFKLLQSCLDQPMWMMFAIPDVIQVKAWLADHKEEKELTVVNG